MECAGRAHGAGGAVTIYYIAPETGADSNDGLSEAAPWRHLPGDPAATHGGVAVPGDEFRLKGGERYPDQIVMPAAGTAEAPISIVGDKWGSTRAILDLSVAIDPINIRPAVSALDAGGAENWRDLYIIEDEAASSDELTQYMDDVEGLLFSGRYPAKSGDPLHFDELYRDAGDYIVHGDGGADLLTHMGDGWITSGALAARIVGQESTVLLGLWTSPNTFAYRRVDHLTGDDIYLDAPVAPYAGRSFAFLLNDRHALTQPGFMAIVAPGKVVVNLREGTGSIRRLRGPFAATFDGRDYTGFEGLTITGVGGSGVQAICNRGGRTGSLGGSKSSTGNFIRRVRVQDMAGVPGGSRSDAFDLRNTTGCEVEGVSFDRLMRAGGMNYGRSNGFRGQYVAIQRASSTALRDAGAAVDSQLKDVILTRCRGVHANGITAYAAGTRSAEDTLFERVAAFDCDRPFTAQGNVNYPRIGLTYRKCLGIDIWTSEYMASFGSLASVAMRLDSHMQAVTIEDSILISSKVGLGISAGAVGNAGYVLRRLTVGQRAQTGLDNGYVDVAEDVQEIRGAAAVADWIAAQTLTARYVRAVGENGPDDVIEIDLRGKVPEEDLLAGHDGGGDEPPWWMDGWLIPDERLAEVRG